MVDVQNRQKTALAAENTAQFAIKNVAKLGFISVGFALLAAGCANRPMPAQPPVASPAPPVVVSRPVQPPVAAAPAMPLVASWADYRRRAAQLMVSANAGSTFTGAAPEMWAGIATVTVFLNADGSVKGLDLMRGSKVSPQVNDLALAAARRVASYGPVTNLPGPWQFNETFLYNENNKFQLVTIVEKR